MSDLPSDVNEHPYVAPPVVIEESMIWVSFRREGIHKYPAALEEEKLADVSFLGYPHRHMFHFKVWIQVRHNDREIEFIQFKRWLESLYQGTLELDYKSCEIKKYRVNLGDSYTIKESLKCKDFENENIITIY